MPGHGELEPDPEPVQRRVTGTDEPHGRQGPAGAANLVQIFAGFKTDIVAEPFRLLMGISVASDVNQQSGVIHRSPVLLADGRPPRYVHCSQRVQGKRNEAAMTLRTRFRTG